MLKLNRSLVNVSRKQRAVWTMQQSSARRERSLQHVPQAQQRAGILQSQDKRAGGRRKIASGRRRRAVRRLRFNARICRLS
jgi:hypothetical protein